VDSAALDSAAYKGSPSLKTGLYQLEKTDLFNLLCIPADGRGGDVPDDVYQEALSYCVKRRAMLIVDPKNGWNSVSAMSRLEAREMLLQRLRRTCAAAASVEERLEPARNSTSGASSQRFVSIGTRAIPDLAAAAVIEAWQEWAPAAPDELYASVLVTASADVQRPPAIDLLGSMLGSEADTAQLLNTFVARAGEDPTSAFHKYMSREETIRYWAELEVSDRDEASEETSGHEFLFQKSEFFRRSLPTEAIAQLLRTLADGRLQGQARELDFSPWGGAYNRVRDDATAL
jgi:hypothetical protein